MIDILSRKELIFSNYDELTLMTSQIHFRVSFCCLSQLENESVAEASGREQFRLVVIKIMFAVILRSRTA